MPDAGHNEAYLLSRAEHYGTQTADTISDLEATVTGYNLNEFTGWVHAVQDAGNQTVNGVKTLGDRLEMNGNKITTLANPSANCGDAANSAYVDSGSTYLVRTAGNQSISDTKHFSSAITDSLKRGTGSAAGTNYGRMSLDSATWGCGHLTWTNFGFNGYHALTQDDGTLHSGSDWTLPVSGVWVLTASLTWPATTYGDYYAAMQWFQNPAVVAQEVQRFWNGDKMTLSIANYFDAGATVTLRVYHDSSHSLLFAANDSDSPQWATACLIA